MQENGALYGIGQLFRLKLGKTAQTLNEPMLVLRQLKNPEAFTLLCVSADLKVSTMLGMGAREAEAGRVTARSLSLITAIIALNLGIKRPFHSGCLRPLEYIDSYLTIHNSRKFTAMK
jgi:hypothetical protein